MDELPPLNRRTYVRLTTTYLWYNLPGVVLAGIIFSLMCIPSFVLSVFGLFVPALILGALMIAPAWTALLAFEAGIVQNRRTNIAVMFKAFPKYWRRSASLGLIGTFPIFAALITLSGLAQPEIPMIVWLGLAADIAGMLVLLILFLYAFPLLVLFDVGLGGAFRNAFVLASRYLIHSFGLLSMGVLFILATVYFSWGLLFFFPAIWGIFIVNNCRLVVAEETSQK